MKFRFLNRINNLCGCYMRWFDKYRARRRDETSGSTMGG